MMYYSYRTKEVLAKVYGRDDYESDDHFLETVAEEFERLTNEIAELKDRNNAANDALRYIGKHVVR